MSSTGRNIAGHERDSRDFYATPSWCVTELYRAAPWLQLPTLDPCAGTGALLRAAPVAATVRGIELDPALVAVADHPSLVQGDGLAEDWSGEHVLINPPYGSALEWMEKGVREALSMVALLRLNIMGAQSRHHFWRNHPPSAVVVLSKRPSFRHGKTDSTEYAWFHWTRDQLEGEPTRLAWITKPCGAAR